MRKEFPQYAWGCIKTLDRRLRHFNINYINYDTPLQDVKNAVENELEGQENFLEYEQWQRNFVWFTISKYLVIW
jgi:hypothetical protein